jgi:hypothetical protein
VLQTHQHIFLRNGPANTQRHGLKRSACVDMVLKHLMIGSNLHEVISGIQGKHLGLLAKRFTFSLSNFLYFNAPTSQQGRRVPHPKIWPSPYILCRK